MKFQLQHFEDDEEEMQTISTHLWKDDHEILKAYAISEGVTFSELARQVFDRLADEPERIILKTSFLGRTASWEQFKLRTPKQYLQRRIAEAFAEVARQIKEATDETGS